jgi:hypothetical protein
MKIQCSCGAKYVFEATPEMLEKPLRFVCSSCGLDASEYVNNLVRQELGEGREESTTEELVGPPASGILSPALSSEGREGEETAPVPVVRVVGRAPGLSIRRSDPEGKHAGETAGAAGVTHTPVLEQDSDTCAKHNGMPTVAKCCVCGRPLCQKCMELFGYVCSPLCKAKANSHGINVPVYEGQASLVEARRWRKVGRIAVALGVLVVALGVFWVWYLFWGCLPKPVFSVRFPEMAYSGQSAMAGKEEIVFLHGDTLARYDMKQQKEIWSRQLGDTNRIEKRVTEQLKWYQAMVERAEKEGWDKVPKIPSREKLRQSAERAAAADLVLRVRNRNIWVTQPEELVRYDWETGNRVKAIPLTNRFGGVIPRGNEMLLVETGSGQPVITHINLTNCETSAEEIGDAELASATGAGNRKAGGQGGGGLPVGAAGSGSDRPLDPAKVAEQAQHLSYAAKLALPAVLAAKANQDRALAETNDGTKRPAPPAAPDPQESSSLVPTKDGLMQVSIRVVESRLTRRSAMKTAPGKSALEGPITAAQSGEMANEILNEMQRERGGEMVTEDNSRYLVKLRRPGEKEGWSGEVTGPPTFFPLDSVNVLAANKSILVFDKSNKLLWKAGLNYNVSGDLSSLEAENATYGQGPCVEHKGGLYVFDEGVLTAFDLATGNARWRLPSVGITGIFFDDHDMMYVNTTTAGPDSIRYSRQIDVSQQTGAVVLKLDSKSGKVLWNAELGGLINYVSGKYLFTVKMYQPYERDEEELKSIQEEYQAPPYLRIKRIDPRTGREMWEHFQQRAPLDIQFDKNTIRLVFRKEVQVLRFLAL